MPAASDLTWDLIPPRRPSLADCGSAQKIDDQLFPPDPLTMPTANEWNLFAKMLSRLGVMMPNVALQVSHSGVAVAAIWSMAANPTVNDPTTYGVMKNGVGDYSVTWPAGTFPNPTRPPRAQVIASGKWFADAQNITNGVRVKTYDSAGAAADQDFIVEEF